MTYYKPTPTYLEVHPKTALFFSRIGVVAGPLLTVMSLILALAVPAVGIIMAGFGLLVFFKSRKLKKQVKKAIKTMEEQMYD